MTPLARNILIYYDKGCMELSALAIKQRLEQYFGKSKKIRLVDSQYLRMKAWEKKTFALVMGGGICSSWELLLQEEGMQKIHTYVTTGGKYLGICAGAYFGAAHSEFRLLDHSPLIKTRPLRFYSGCAYGPLIPTTNHLSPQSALALKVTLVKEQVEGLSYYQGGPVFDLAQSTSTNRVLMQYDDPIRLAAAIGCAVGSGKAVLCGTHPEFFWERREGEPLPSALAENEEFCRKIWHTLLQELQDE